MQPALAARNLLISVDCPRKSPHGRSQNRCGAELTALKEVKPVDATYSAYTFRNQTVLTLLAAPRAARINSA